MPPSPLPWVCPELTCEDGHAVEAAVQLAEQDGEEAVCSQHAGVPCALVIDYHVLRLCGLHLGAMRAEVRALLGTCRKPPSPAATHCGLSGTGREGLRPPCCLEGRAAQSPPTAQLTPGQVETPTATQAGPRSRQKRGTLVLMPCPHARASELREHLWVSAGGHVHIEEMQVNVTGSSGGTHRCPQGQGCTDTLRATEARGKLSPGSPGGTFWGFCRWDAFGPGPFPSSPASDGKRTATRATLDSGGSSSKLGFRALPPPQMPCLGTRCSAASAQSG